MTTTALAIEDFSREKIDLIKRTICAGATDDELQLFLYTCKRTGLDPLARQIHMVKRWNAQARREVATIQTGIDGYRLIADRTGKLAGISDPIYGAENAEGHPASATVTVRKIVGSNICDFTASARFSEYVQTYKPKDSNKIALSPMWAKMPFLMLGKCAEALALRKAFPADLSGVYTAEEMAQADNQPEEQAQEIQQQRTPAAPQIMPPAKPSQVVFIYGNGQLTCIPSDVQERESKKGENFYAVKLNGECEGKKIAFCWHKSLYDAIKLTMNERAVFAVELQGGYLNIVDVLAVGEQEFRDGKPYTETKADPIFTDADLPDSMFEEKP